LYLDSKSDNLPLEIQSHQRRGLKKRRMKKKEEEEEEEEEEERKTRGEGEKR
jgi:hypothetical protein